RPRAASAIRYGSSVAGRLASKPACCAAGGGRLADIDVLRRFGFLHYNIGTIHLAEGRHAAAIRCIREAANWDTGNAQEALLTIADAAVRAGSDAYVRHDIGGVVRAGDALPAARTRPPADACAGHASVPPRAGFAGTGSRRRAGAARAHPGASRSLPQPGNCGLVTGIEEAQAFLVQDRGGETPGAEGAGVEPEPIRSQIRRGADGVAMHDEFLEGLARVEKRPADPDEILVVLLGEGTAGTQAGMNEQVRADAVMQRETLEE